MAYSYNEVTATGSPQLITVPPYIDPTHIKVSVNAIDTGAYTWTNDSTVSVTATAGAKVRVRRESSPAARVVNYIDGVALPASVLNADSKQAFYLVQEQLDAPISAATSAAEALAASVVAAAASVTATSAAAAAASAAATAAADAAALLSPGAFVGRTSATGAAAVPAGSTAQRDGAPVVGHFRYNNTLNTFEGYGGASPAWGPIGGGGNTFAQNNLNVPAGSGMSLVGPITFSGTTTISGRLVIQ